jgi:hypothetical protein
MNRKEREAQRREDERRYHSAFIGRLNAVVSFDEALGIAYDKSVPPDSIGRLRHTSLAHFLAGFSQTDGIPRLSANREFPTVPGGATRGERAAYAALVKRMAEAGEISVADAQYVADKLNSVPLTPSDFI